MLLTSNTANKAALTVALDNACKRDWEKKMSNPILTLQRVRGRIFREVSPTSVAASNIITLAESRVRRGQR